MLVLWHKVANQQVKRIIMLKCLLFVSLLLAQPINSCHVFTDEQKFHRKTAGAPVYLEVGNVTPQGDFVVSAEKKELAIRRIVEKNPEMVSIVHTAEFQKGLDDCFTRGFKIKTIEDQAEVGYATIVDAGEKLAVTLFAINEPYRRKGYAKQAILTIEGIVKAHKRKWPGVNLIFFHVNAQNIAMTSLLINLGYDLSVAGEAFHFTKPIPA